MIKTDRWTQLDLKNTYDLHELREAIEVGKDPPVLFVGSFISTYAPTNIPNGMEIAKQIFSMLFENDDLSKLLSADDLKLIRNVFCPEWDSDKLYGDGIPFEMLFDNKGNCDDVKAIFCSYFKDVKPNSFHKMIARMVHNGKIDSIITPNYDPCISRAYSKMYGDGSLFSIYDEAKYREYCSMTNETKVCFYIHGSAESNDTSNICITSSDENEMNIWKRELLLKMLKGRDLVVVGYSGKDFEICPVLYDLRKRKVINRVVYNNKYDEVTYNIRQLLESSDETTASSRDIFAVGDVVDFVRYLFDVSIEDLPAGDVRYCSLYEDIERVILSQKKDWYIWVYKLLVYMGCVKQANKIDKLAYEIHAEESATYIMAKAGMEYKSGKYLASAQLYKHLFMTRRYGIDAAQLLDIVCDCLESYRAGYYLVRAAMYYGIAYIFKMIFNRKLHTSGQSAVYKLSYRYTMLIKNFMLLFGIRSKLLTKIVIRRYARGCKNANKSGNRILLQNYALELMSMKALLNEEQIRNLNSLVQLDVIGSVKESSYGYEELGTVFELIIYKRRELMNKWNIGLNGRSYIADKYDRDQMVKLARIAFECGIYPEAYKCMKLANEPNLKYGDIDYEITQLLGECEYSWYLKLRLHMILLKLSKM